MRDWLLAHGLAILFWAILLFLLFRFARPLIHRLLVGVVRGQELALGSDEAQRNELDKRVKTLEDLLAKALRIGVIVAGILVVFSVFEVWPVLTGVGIFAAAITLAGQSIVLDYLMGILILVEGQYYVGDVVNVGGIEGTVEEIGFRRTTLRDTSGTVHSISNGEIRTSANLTRVYASAVVDIQGINDADVERAIAAMSQVGEALAQDPDWSPRLLAPPGQPIAFAFTDLGATIRMSCRVIPEDRWRVAAEVRKRIATAFTEAGIEPNRRTGAAARV
jgi:moderate conductance mechanosensitive channel